MGTSIGQRLIDRGWQQGRQQGLEQSVLRVLTRRFEAVPPSLSKKLSRIDSPERLEGLLDSALAAGSLEEFTQGLE